jgi:hypothetical protein
MINKGSEEEEFLLPGIIISCRGNINKKKQININIK